MGLQPFEIRSLGILVVSGIIYLLVNQLPEIEGEKWISWFLNLSVKTISVSTLFLLAAWKFNLSPDMNQLIKNYLNK